MVMISDYCKMEGEGLLEGKTSQKPLRNHNLRSLFIERERQLNHLNNKHEGRRGAICSLNDVANVSQGTDELNISHI